MTLSPSFSPVPEKIVSRIKSGAYLHLRELLGDNIALPQRSGKDVLALHISLIQVIPDCIIYFEWGSKNNSDTMKDFSYEIKKVPVQLFQLNDPSV